MIGRNIFISKYFLSSYSNKIISLKKVIFYVILFNVYYFYKLVVLFLSFLLLHSGVFFMKVKRRRRYRYLVKLKTFYATTLDLNFLVYLFSFLVRINRYYTCFYTCFRAIGNFILKVNDFFFILEYYFQYLFWDFESLLLRKFSLTFSVNMITNFYYLRKFDEYCYNRFFYDFYKLPY